MPLVFGVGPGLDIRLEPHLEWECYRMQWRSPLGIGSPRPIVIAGRESYPQLVYALTVRPHVLETDPGPLDARVP